MRWGMMRQIEGNVGDARDWLGDERGGTRFDGTIRQRGRDSRVPCRTGVPVQPLYGYSTASITEEDCGNPCEHNGDVRTVIYVADKMTDYGFF